jgi:hypothetical protein
MLNSSPISSGWASFIFTILCAGVVTYGVFITVQNKVIELEKRVAINELDIKEVKTGLNVIIRLEVVVEGLTKAVEDLEDEIKQSNQKKQGN